VLEQNYRSTQTILSAANAVIARNPDRRPKRLWTASGDGSKIVGYVADTEHDEAAFIAGEIDTLGDDHGVRPCDVAVFYRTNAQSRAIEEVLVRVGLPYKIVGGTRFYERREVKDALAYLRVLANGADTVNLRRILNVPKRGIGDRAEAVIAQLADRERIAFVEALARADEAPGIATRSLSCVRAFTELLEALRTIVDAGPGRRRCSRPCSSRPATSPSCRRATTRRTRPGSRTSPSWCRWPASSRRPRPTDRSPTSSSGSPSWPTATTSRTPKPPSRAW
jgi:DNA helicase-2/ATP-dependent DNA helicase PcrA